MKIIKTYQEQWPNARFIGKKYTDEDRVNGSFGKFWGESFQKGWFGPLEGAFESCKAKGQLDAVFDGSYFGWMQTNDGFEYWIGMLFPEGTDVPEGYAHIDIPAQSYAISWLNGKEKTGELYGMDAHNRSVDAARNGGYNVSEPFTVAFERYNCPRFTEADEHGNVILDYGLSITD